jgi:hypothetical protein
MNKTRALTGLILALSLACARAEDDDNSQTIIFKGGVVIPLDSVQIAEGRITITKDVPGFVRDQSYPLDTIDRIGGAEPLEFRKSVAEILVGNPLEAIKLLTPIIAQQRFFAAIPGNFWVEAMRLNMLANALAGRASKVDEIARDMNQTAKKEAAGDSTAELARMIASPINPKPDARAKDLSKFVNDLHSAELNGIALFLAADVLLKAHKDDEALDIFISASSIYPTAGPSVVAACEFRTADLILRLNRTPEIQESKISSKSEALATFKSAAKYGADTIIAQLAGEKIKSLE